MAKRHVKRGDEVVVLTGKDKGKTGSILEIDTKKNRVVVDGVNIVKRHTKPQPPAVPQGGILEKAMSIHISNVMVISPSTKEPTRVKRDRREGDDGKMRGVRLDKNGDNLFVKGKKKKKK